MVYVCVPFILLHINGQEAGGRYVVGDNMWCYFEYFIMFMLHKKITQEHVNELRQNFAHLLIAPLFHYNYNKTELCIFSVEKKLVVVVGSTGVDVSSSRHQSFLSWKVSVLIPSAEITIISNVSVKN